MGCHFVLGFPGLPPSLTPRTGAPSMLSPPVSTYLQEKKKEGLPPGFPVAAWVAPSRLFIREPVTLLIFRES